MPATRETPEQFRQVIDVNLNGCYWMAQACGRVMQPGSSIINISSVLGLTTAGLPQAAYASSKAGLIGLTRDLAQQWTGRKGIRVNAIAPGFFDSEMTDQYPEGYLESQGPRIPLRPQGRPARARRDRGLPGLGRRRLHHRPDAPGRRRDDHHLSADQVNPAATSGQGVEEQGEEGEGREQALDGGGAGLAPVRGDQDQGGREHRAGAEDDQRQATRLVAGNERDPDRRADRQEQVVEALVVGQGRGDRRPSPRSCRRRGGWPGRSSAATRARRCRRARGRRARRARRRPTACAQGRSAPGSGP